MARLAVPPMDARLRSVLLPVLTQKRLSNDALWRSEVLPLLLEYLNALGHLVRQSVTTNAHAPTSKIVDEIHQTLGTVTRNLTRSFASAAPFTIHRVAELFLAYEESEYSLATVVLAQKWLLALARTLSVSSSELSYNLKRYPTAPPLSTSAAADEQRSDIPEEECRRHNLPSNIRFVRLPWSPKSPSVTPADEPVLKRQKPSTEEGETESPPEIQSKTVQTSDPESTDKRSESPKPNPSHVLEQDLGSTESITNIPDAPQSLIHVQISADEYGSLRNDTRTLEPKLLESRTGDNQDSTRSSFCKNGSIDFDEQRRHKEEVLI